MDKPKELRGSEGCQVLSYLPEQMLSFTWNSPPTYPIIRNHEHQTWVVVNFEAAEEGKTKVILHHLGWLSGGQWDEVYAYFDNAWEIVLNWLEKSGA